MTSKKEIDREKKRQAALALVEQGGARRDSMAGLSPAPVPPAATRPAPVPPAATRPAPVPPAATRPAPPTDSELEIEPAAEAFPDVLYSIGGKRGLAARGWKSKNTFFHPKISAAGLELAQELGIEFSELTNLALASIVDPRLRTTQTDTLLAEIRQRNH